MSDISKARISQWLKSAESALNHDFCPGANRWVYWLKNPLWCLVLAFLASLACGYWVNRYVFLISGVLVGVVALGLAWPMISIRGIGCRLSSSRTRTRVGDRVTICVTVTNRWPWPVWGLQIRDGFGEQDHTHGDANAALSRVGGWSTREFQWNFTPMQRGVYPQEQPTIETGFPFGLYRAAVSILTDMSVIVWPRTVPLHAMLDAAQVAPQEDRFTDRRVGDFGDMTGTRIFRNGDSLRRVHWAQSARQGRMIVCEHQAPASSAVQVVLDTCHAHHTGTGASSTLEGVIDTAASICESLHQQHAYVECVIDGQVHVCGCSHSDYRRLMDTLAAIPAKGHRYSDGSASQSIISHRSDLLQITITSDVGFRKLFQHRHVSSDVRILVIGSTEPFAGKHIDELHCRGCRPWLTIQRRETLPMELPLRWRRACHGA